MDTTSLDRLQQEIFVIHFFHRWTGRASPERPTAPQGIQRRGCARAGPSSQTPLLCDLDARLEKLGGTRVAVLELGGDQDADGYQTGYKTLQNLGALALEGVGPFNFLRRTILKGSEDNATGSLAPSDGQLTKFRDIYQQDEHLAQEVEPAFAFMIRIRMPGGVFTPEGCDQKCYSILFPRTTAYHEIWLDKKMVAGEALKDFEPLYGEFHLPRKFKVAIAVPPTNDVGVFANDLGIIAIVDDNGELTGFNVTVGGGLGVTHGNKKTYPRTGDLIGFCTPEQGKYVAEMVMLTRRDNGNRAEFQYYLTDNVSKNARVKYTVDRMGLDVFKIEVEGRLGYQLQPARPFTFDRDADEYGCLITTRSSKTATSQNGFRASR
ncbi:hypothetical protein F5877DRAFT_82729 [Lentinula edodes]|nr:hypothetical protein F5877DRAFT_82729 [Lentinula edodes]